MDPRAYLDLLSTLQIGSTELAVRLGGCAEDYEKLKERQSLPFPVWDALQRMAHREGYAWDGASHSWQKIGAMAALTP